MTKGLRLVAVNGGGSFALIGNRFAVQGSHRDLLLRLLPPIAHLRKEKERTALRRSVDSMMQELRDPAPGGHLAGIAVAVGYESESAFSTAST